MVVRVNDPILAAAELRHDGAPAFKQRVAHIVEVLLEGISTGPTDLDAAGKRLGVRAMHGCVGLPYAGALARQPDGAFELMYSIEQPQTRRRFTIAHELGHAVLDRAGWSADADVERLCDMFAAELLLPRRQLAERLADGLSSDVVIDLAHRYQMSLHATAISCAEQTTAIIMRARPADVVWTVGSDDLRYVGTALQETAQMALDQRSFVKQRVRRGERALWQACATPLDARNEVLLVLTPRGGDG